LVVAGRGAEKAKSAGMGWVWFWGSMFCGPSGQKEWSFCLAAVTGCTLSVWE